MASLLLAILALAGALLTAGSRNSPGEPWKGWKLLLVDPASDAKSLETMLRSQGYRSILNRNSQLVDIADYSGSLVAVPLPELAKRLLPQDPRLDSYAKGLEGYFLAESNGKPLQIWYLKRTVFPLSPISSLGDSLAKAGAFFPFGDARGWLDIDSVQLALCLAGFLLVCVRPGQTRARVNLALPWILLFLCGRSYSLSLAGAFSYPLLAPAILSIADSPLRWREGWSSRLRIQMIHSLPALFPFYVALITEPALVAFFGPVGIVAIGATIVWERSRNAPSPAKHRRFIAVKIGGAQRSGLEVPNLSYFLGTILLFVLSLAPSLPRGSLLEAFPLLRSGESAGYAPTTYLPLPMREADEGFRSAALPGEGVKDADRAPLVNLLDFKAHLHSQSTFFSSPLPAEGGSQGATQAQKAKEVPSASAQFARPEGPLPLQVRPLSVEKLLLDQGEEVIVRVSLMLKEGARPLAPFSIILYILPMALTGCAALRIRSRNGFWRSRTKA